MLKKQISLVKREVGSLKSEKTILVAIAIQLLVASFSSILIVGVVSTYSPDAAGQQQELTYGVVGPDKETVYPLLNERDNVETATYIEKGDAIEAFNRGDINAIIHISQSQSGYLNVKITAPAEGFEKTTVISTMQDILNELEKGQRSENSAELSVQPLKVPDNVDSSPYEKFTYTVLLPILMFLPAFISGSLVSDSIIEAKSKGTIELLKVTQLSDVDIFDAKCLTLMIITPIQASLWIILLQFNGAGIQNVFLILLVTTGIAVITSSIGGFVSYYLSSRAQSQFAYAIVSVTAFTVFYAGPENPINTISKLAVGTIGPYTIASVVSYILIGILLYALIRRQVKNNGFKKPANN